MERAEKVIDDSSGKLEMMCTFNGVYIVSLQRSVVLGVGLKG